MALTVNTNIASMSALTQLNQSNRALSGTLERISTGLRINSAADDAAGLAVAENLDAQSRSLSVAARNTNDGIAIIQTAESASSEVSNILKRMRELAVQSASDTLGDPERAYIQEEFLGLSAEIDRIAAGTEFNGVSLADGSAPTISVQVGINNTVNDQIDITLGDLRAATMGVDVGSVDMWFLFVYQWVLCGASCLLEWDRPVCMATPAVAVAADARSANVHALPALL